MNIARRFDHLQALGVLLLAALFLAGAPASAQEKLPRQRIQVAGHPLTVEVAASDPHRQQGLMHRKSLGKDDGMLFVFDEPAYHSMWMKNTLIPLSVAFVDAQGTILNILDMEPQTLDSHMSAGPSLYAVETNKGWFAARGVKAGDRITGLPKKGR